MEKILPKHPEAAIEKFQKSFRKSCSENFQTGFYLSKFEKKGSTLTNFVGNQIKNPHSFLTNSQKCPYFQIPWVCQFN